LRPPLIDPREGDVEDDASSTRGRSFLAVTGTLVAEISPAKLALAAVVLVVVPGALLGLTPLLLGGWLATLSGQVASAAGLVAVPVVVAVAAVGWLGGRPLLRLAERSFWSLNALAVQPGYALFREALRHGVERVVAKRGSRDELARTRAASAAAAGLLASALAVAVFALAWPSTRWIGVPADLADPLRLIEPALSNTLALLSGYLALASLGWGLADATMAQPHGVARFDVPAEGAPRWRVAHLSDLHTVGGPYEFRLESGRAGPRGNDRLERALRRLDACHAARPLDLVLVTGDTTDAGRATEWAAFLDALERRPAVRERTLLLPGNHDLNVIDRANPARLDLPGSPRKQLRRLRTLSAMEAVQGERVHVLAADGAGLGSTLAAALAPERAAIRHFAATGATPGRGWVARLWHAAFPLVRPPDRPDGLGVVMLNSNAETHFSFTNALGLVTAEQARGIAALARLWPEARWLVALHHHVVEYPRPVATLAARIGTVLINGSWFVRELRPLAERAVVLHGHRHIDWIGACAGVRLVSAPSPVMAPAGAARFNILTLAAGAGGRLDLAAPEPVAVDGEGAAG
jgi:hypothetical protein